MLDALLDRSILFSFDRGGFLRHSKRFHPEETSADLRGRVCLVTGANSGIGFETSKALAARGATVHMLCRDRGRGEAALERVRAAGTAHLHLVDVSDLGSIQNFLSAFSEPVVDVLVHNAGVLPDRRIETHDGLELTWATHIRGPFALTAGLQPRLIAAGGARVITVSSGGMYTQRLDLLDIHWKNRPFDGVTAYAQTKRAQLILSELWAERLEGRVHFSCMHPGWADTPAVRSSLPRFYRLMKGRLRTPEEGADTVIWLAVSPSIAAVSGRFWFDRAEAPAHMTRRTVEPAADRQALWGLCVDQVAPLKLEFDK